LAWEQQERALRAKRRELLRRLESGDRSERRSLRDMVGELWLRRILSAARRSRCKNRAITGCGRWRRP